MTITHSYMQLIEAGIGSVIIGNLSGYEFYKELFLYYGAQRTMKKSIGIGSVLLLNFFISAFTIWQQSGSPPLGSFFGGNAKGGFGISPDGSRLAYVAASPTGRLIDAILLGE